MNLCTSCGLDFGSVSAFDAHRVGVHEYTSTEGLQMDPPREDGRRCLAVHELKESPKFTLNTRGAWSLSTSIAYGRTRRGLTAESHV